MKRQMLLVMVVLLVAGSLLAVQPARASGYYYNFASVGGATCDNHHVSIPDSFSWNLPPTVIVHLNVALNGHTLYDYTGTIGGGTGSGSDDAGNGFPPTSYPYTYVMTFQVILPDGTGFQTIITATCSSAGHLTFSILNGQPLGGASSAGPTVPAGFVMKTITCDVAVFDAPDGVPVGDNHLAAGQTWYVNPTPVKGNDGKEWTEFFDGGYTDAYIPTRCVQ